MLFRLDTLVGEPIGKLQINHKQTLNWLLAVQRFYPSQGLHEVCDINIVNLRHVLFAKKHIFLVLSKIFQDLCNRLGVDNSSSEFC